MSDVNVAVPEVRSHNSAPPRTIVLLAFCAATVLLIPLEAWIPGLVAWAVSVIALRWCDVVFRRRLAVLLGVILLLALAPINTDRSTPHWLVLAPCFAAAVFGPWLIFRKTDPGVIDWCFWPRRFRWLDIIYTAVSVPVAWVVIPWYFFQINPDLPTHWSMPAVYSDEAFWRLFSGINAVGIWDELFFINIVYATLRSVVPVRVANVVQAVVYASVLNDMAFTGIGPVLIYLFALTQGSMYEQSRTLLYVLIVHLVVDAFLVSNILTFYYPGGVPFWF